MSIPYLLKIACLLCFCAATMNAQGPTSRAVASDDQLKVFLGKKMLLQNDRDGYMSVHRIVYSPNGKNFVVIGCGFECTDNIGFLFRADGTRKRKFTARWDVILDDKLEWSTDGTKIYYFRINSTGADPPKTAPPEGWVVVDVATGRKGPATTRRLDQRASYSVFNTGDGLAVRAAPGVNAKEVGRLPSDAKGVRITGPGRLSGRALWVPIKHNALSGWVNQNFLFRDEAPQARNLDSIAGIDWVLRAWKTDEPAPASPEVTLKFENGKFVGRSGCNRYSSPVTEGPASGSIKVGPTISTRMACAEPAMAVENRFLKQLEAVTKFELSSDQLALTYELEGAVEVMLFEKK
ncbi:MAG TPA: META domain-containing protein [Pyrinomonadaceae bacterium]|nr:META domain-containing protein [Pyrinomonadaceae bacterium]